MMLCQIQHLQKSTLNLADSYDHILERNFMKYNASKFLKNSLAGGTTFDASKIYVNSI